MINESCLVYYDVKAEGNGLKYLWHVDPEYVPLQDIVIRQAMTGSAYLFYTESSNSLKAAMYAERNEKVRLFYEYVQENHTDNYEVSWSEWLEEYSKKKAA